MQRNAVTSRLVLTVEQPVGGGGTHPPTQWQYIGFVQVVPGGWWGTNLNNPYNTGTTFSLQRVAKTQLVNTGGPLFHLKMSNHGNRTRSEEHTSELQSPDHLVCRLLLE